MKGNFKLHTNRADGPVQERDSIPTPGLTSPSLEERAKSLDATSPSLELRRSLRVRSFFLQCNKHLPELIKDAPRSPKSGYA